MGVVVCSFSPLHTVKINIPSELQSMVHVMVRNFNFVIFNFHLSSNFLVNSADRVIRVFNIDEILKADDDDDIEALQRLQDLVNRTQWKKCTFSGDGEFIVAGSHRQHALYIWDKATGSLVKMLTGQKGETLLDIAVSTVLQF